MSHKNSLYNSSALTSYVQKWFKELRAFSYTLKISVTPEVCRFDLMERTQSLADPGQVFRMLLFCWAEFSHLCVVVCLFQPKFTMKCCTQCL